MEDKRRFDYDARGRTIINGSKTLTMEAKWWAIEEMIKLYAEDELPDKIYDKLFDERWEIEKEIAALKPQNSTDIVTILRMTRKAYDTAWGPAHDTENPCPTGQNILSAMDNVIAALEEREISKIPNKKQLAEEKALLQKAGEIKHSLAMLYDEMETTVYETDAAFLTAKGELGILIEMLSGGCATTSGLAVARETINKHERFLESEKRQANNDLKAA